MHKQKATSTAVHKKGILLIARKETSLEVNAEKYKYMVMCQDQNTEHNNNIKIGTISFERWNISNIWKHHQQIKVPLVKKLRED
jgi:hypothetical protein